VGGPPLKPVRRPPVKLRRPSSAGQYTSHRGVADATALREAFSSVGDAGRSRRVRLSAVAGGAALGLRVGVGGADAVVIVGDGAGDADGDPAVSRELGAGYQTGSRSAQRTALLPELWRSTCNGRLAQRIIELGDRCCRRRTDNRIAFARNDATCPRNVASTASAVRVWPSVKMPQVFA
jgi:hypothetical protein